MTITLREKGKTLEQGGGMVTTTDMWLAPKIAGDEGNRRVRPALRAEAVRRLFAGASAEQMAAAMAMYPMMKQALGRMSAEGAKIDGTAIMTTVTMDAVKSRGADGRSRRKRRTSRSRAAGSVGGLLGGLAAKKLAPKADDDDTASRARRS